MSRDMQGQGQDFLWICRLSGAPWGPFHISVVLPVTPHLRGSAAGRWLVSDRRAPLHGDPKPPIWKELVYKALDQKYAAHVSEKPEIILYICSPLTMEM